MRCDAKLCGGARAIAPGAGLSKVPMCSGSGYSSACLSLGHALDLLFVFLFGMNRDELGRVET